MRARILSIWKPSVGKIVLALAALLVTAFTRYRIQAVQITDLWSWGFPSAFYQTWGPCPADMTCRSFDVSALLIDLLAYSAVPIVTSVISSEHSLSACDRVEPLPAWAG